MFAFLDAFNIPDFVPHGEVELEEALAAYDRHRDAAWVMACLKISSAIPVTFDGTPVELVGADGHSTKPIKIGDRIVYPDAANAERVGVVEEVTASGSEAWLVVHDQENATRNIVKIPLTEAEASAAQRYGDVVFGKPNASRPLQPDDIFGLYDWLLEAHKDIDRERALKNLEHHPRLGEYQSLSVDDLRVRICREAVKAMHARARSSAAN